MSEVSPSGPEQLTYQRQDTSTDWQAQFAWIPQDKGLSPREFLTTYLQENLYQLDHDQKVTEDCDHFFEELKTTERMDSFVRVEGTATLNEEERCYLDIFIYKDLLKNGFLLAVSKSSVLNGVIEGPYFEKVIRQLEIID